MKSMEAYSGVFNFQPSVAFQLGGKSTSVESNDIAIDSNGNVWVTGDFRHSIDIDGDGEDDLTSNGSVDSYVVKFDSEGDLVKAYDFGSSGWDFGVDIATDSNGNAWAIGTFRGSIDIDGDGKNDLTRSSGGNYLAKFDEEGDLVKALEIDGDHHDLGNSIATDSNGNVWTKGRFEGSIDLNLDGINDLTSNGKSDSYFAKFDEEGMDWRILASA
ncbi:MAG: SBBP repeat-containing protein [Hormoscilla sp. GUM202]|nr:SBBP repeat-containing protein [Hormoscilla sp. GUM202]